VRAHGWRSRGSSGASPNRCPGQPRLPPPVGDHPATAAPWRPATAQSALGAGRPDAGHRRLLPLPAALPERRTRARVGTACPRRGGHRPDPARHLGAAGRARLLPPAAHKADPSHIASDFAEGLRRLLRETRNPLTRIGETRPHRWFGPLQVTRERGRPDPSPRTRTTPTAHGRLHKRACGSGGESPDAHGLGSGSVGCWVPVSSVGRRCRRPRPWVAGSAGSSGGRGSGWPPARAAAPPSRSSRRRESAMTRHAPSGAGIGRSGTGTSGGPRAGARPDPGGRGKESRHRERARAGQRHRRTRRADRVVSASSSSGRRSPGRPSPGWLSPPSSETGTQGVVESLAVTGV
jgi:hypothetical protein